MNRFVAALVLAVVVTACSTPSSVPATGDFGGGESGFEPAGSKVNLFVANREDVLEYTRRGHLVRTTPLGKYAPAGAIAFDKSGNLYAVSDYFAASVFAPKSRALVRTITDGMFEPLALAVDRSDNLYVANGSNGYNGNIAIYPPGSATASRTITDGIYDPESLAFDSSGNLYVANNANGTATVYAPRIRKLLRTISKEVGAPWVVAVDYNDNLYLGSFGSTDKIGIYPPGHAVPARTIASFALSLGVGPP